MEVSIYCLIAASILSYVANTSGRLFYENHMGRPRRPSGAVSPGGVSCRQTVGECDTCRCADPAKSLVQAIEPVQNGCGADWFPEQLRDRLNVFGFAECCNTHDRCYGTCGTSQEECDGIFYDCMTHKCSAVGGWKNYMCDAAALDFYGMLKIGGCYTYVASQKKRCACE